MKFNTPLPKSLPKECDKAAKIIQSFVDSRNNGLDGVIPRNVLQNAKGFAIFTVAKAGFVLSARAGSGIVIAKLDNGTWTAPSAIGTAGVGFGSQAGAEVTDFLVILNTRAAIRSFMAAGSLTLGGNLSIALGPLGRNGEAVGSVSTGGNVTAMYSYSKTRGLFGGISIEGSVIVERKDANVEAYKSPVTVKMLLSGAVDPPLWAEVLIKTLESCTGMPGQRDWIRDESSRSPGQGYAFAGPGSQSSPSPSTHSRKISFLKRKKPDKQAFPPLHWGIDNDGASGEGNYFDRNPTDFGMGFSDGGLERRSSFTSHNNPTIHPGTGSTLVGDLDDPFDNINSASTISATRERAPRATSFNGIGYPYSSYSSSASRSRSQSTHVTFEDNDDPLSPFSESRIRTSQHFKSKPELTQLSEPGKGLTRAIALFDFEAVEDGDLSFSKGDVITVIEKSGSTDDWWTGRLNNREGIFPANFVEVT